MFTNTLQPIILKYVIIAYCLIACATAVPLYSFSIDHKYPKDDSLFWELHYNIPYIMAGTLVTTALIEGSESRFGQTTWKSVEAMTLTYIATDAIKWITGRKRPRDSEHPNAWWNFGHKSFPSAHASMTTAMVTPFILEYRQDRPGVYALSGLVVYQMMGRIKTQAHWLSDVLVGAMLGGGIAYGRFGDSTNWLLQWSRDRKFVGLRYRF